MEEYYMKRALAISLALVMFFSIVSCDVGGSSVTEIPTDPDETDNMIDTEEGSETDPYETESNVKTDESDAVESAGETDSNVESDSTGETDSTGESEDTDNNEGDETEDIGGGDVNMKPTNPTYVVEYPYTDRQGVVHITFQDTYTFKSDAVEILEQTVTSYKTGTNEKDDAVLTVKDGAVYASGCGIANVKLADGSVECVVVHASPINLLFLTGQSNGSGDPPSEDCYEKNEYQDYFINSPETMAYYTWTGQGLSIYNAVDYVTKTLEWGKPSGVKSGCEPDVLTKENYTGGFKNFSVCAGLAYEWVNQTGERVWIVNASHGGQPIHCFKPSEDGTVVDNDYYQAITVFNLALETLYKEVDAGHFTLNHMAYYWFQGEGDSSNTYEYYYEAFAEMHEAIQEDVVYKHNGVEKKLEYCGIFTIRSSYNDISELYLSGPRLAQYTAANQLEGAYKNVFLATKATESWIISDKNVEDYFLGVYGSNEAFKAIFGYDIPNTLKLVHPQIHYRIFGQNEMGMDAARNTLRFLNYLYPDNSYQLDYAEEELSLKLVGRDGYYELGDTLYFDAGSMVTHVIPYITPVWRTVEGLSIKVLTEGFEVEGFRIISKNQTATEVVVEVYLGDVYLMTKTFNIKYRSSFADNPPLVINKGTAAYPNRVFEDYQGGWDAGFLTYSTKKFEEFRAVHKDGWIYDGIDLWNVTSNGGGHGGVIVSGGVKISPTSNYVNDGTIGIRYTTGKTGKIKIGATSFSTNLAEACYIAVFINGEMVWPANGTATNLGTWKLLSKAATPDTLNNLWADVSFDVKAGDEIVFAVGRYDKNPQAVFYPTVEYID